jgi:hypothetical protein
MRYENGSTAGLAHRPAGRKDAKSWHAGVVEQADTQDLKIKIGCFQLPPVARNPRFYCIDAI